jgi:hypothetical protein
MTRRLPTPQCPIRPGEPCTLCFPGATGPQDCGLVYLVESDDEMREQLAERRRAVLTARKVMRPTG